MHLDLWDPGLAQNRMALRVGAELALEEPRHVRIIWTYRSPWRDVRLNATGDSADVLLNHAPGTNLLTRKTILPRLLRLQNLAHLAPPTYILPAERPLLATARRRQVDRQWVSKAATHGSVQILRRGDEPPRTGVVQPRVEPVLLNGTHHFDVGVYALLGPDGTTHLYDDVLVRLARRDTFAIGKGYLPAWEASSPLARWMPECAASAACALGRAHPGAAAALQRMRTATRDILHALAPHASRLAGRRRTAMRYFELFRFDFLLDAERPWLSEVNASPSMIPMHPEDERVKHALLRDALRTVARGRPIGGWRIG